MTTVFVLVKTAGNPKEVGFEVAGVEVFVDAAKAIAKHREVGGVVYEAEVPSWPE